MQILPPTHNLQWVSETSDLLLLKEVHVDVLAFIDHTTDIALVLEEVHAVIRRHKFLHIVDVASPDIRNLIRIDDISHQNLATSLGILTLRNHSLQQAGNLNADGSLSSHQTVNDVAPAIISATSLSVNHVTRPISEKFTSALPDFRNRVAFECIVQERVVGAKAQIFIHSHLFFLLKYLLLATVASLSTLLTL